MVYQVDVKIILKLMNCSLSNKRFLFELISKRNNISKAASLLPFNAFKTQIKSPISRYRRFKLYFMLANLDMAFRYDFEKVLWSGQVKTNKRILEQIGYFKLGLD